MTKPIVVTGAHGFLGRHVARSASRAGYTVYGIGHGAWLREEWELWGLTYWQRSDVTFQALQQIPVRPVAVIHCAGSGSVAFSIANPIEDLQRTVLTTAAVLEFVRMHSPSACVVYPSSAGVYGDVDHIPINEDTTPAPVSPYGSHKLMAEQIIRSYARNFSVRTAVIRFFSIFGSGLKKQFLWDACGKLSRHDFLFSGTGQEVRDWIHVEDAASLLITALEHASTECVVVNGGTGRGTTVSELLSRLAVSLGQSETKPVFTNLTRPGDPARYVADVAKAQAWGWTPEKLLAERVAEYVEWWLREMGLTNIADASNSSGTAGNSRLSE